MAVLLVHFRWPLLAEELVSSDKNVAVPAHVEGSSAATSQHRRDHLEFACTNLAKKAKTFNLTVTNLSVSTLLRESRLLLDTSGTKAVFGPTKRFPSHVDVNMCRLRGQV